MGTTPFTHVCERQHFIYQLVDVFILNIPVLMVLLKQSMMVLCHLLLRLSEVSSVDRFAKIQKIKVLKCAKFLQDI